MKHVHQEERAGDRRTGCGGDLHAERWTEGSEKGLVADSVLSPLPGSSHAILLSPCDGLSSPPASVGHGLSNTV